MFQKIYWNKVPFDDLGSELRFTAACMTRSLSKVAMRISLPYLAARQQDSVDCFPRTAGRLRFCLECSRLGEFLGYQLNITARTSSWSMRKCCFGDAEWWLPTAAGIERKAYLSLSRGSTPTVGSSAKKNELANWLPSGTNRYRKWKRLKGIGKLLRPWKVSF